MANEEHTMEANSLDLSPTEADPSASAEGDGNPTRSEVARLLDDLKKRVDADRDEEALAFEIIQVGKEKELSRRLSARFAQLNSWITRLSRIVREQEILLNLANAAANEQQIQGETGIVPTPRQEMLLRMARRPELRSALLLRVFNPPAVSADGLVNCEHLVEQCLARCCKLRAPLTLEEAASGQYEWSEEDPFCLRRLEDGYCKHLSREGTFHCTIYDNRPSVCRSFFCDTALKPAEAHDVVPSNANSEPGDGREFEYQPKEVDDLIIHAEQLDDVGFHDGGTGVGKVSNSLCSRDEDPQPPRSLFCSDFGKGASQAPERTDVRE